MMIRSSFATAWCADLSLISNEQAIFIPEPRFVAPEVAARTVLPGLRYLVRIRFVAASDGGELGGDRDGGDGGHGDGRPVLTPRELLEDRPGIQWRPVEIAKLMTPSTVMVGALQCPLARAVPGPTIRPPIGGGGTRAWACHASGACDIDSGAMQVGLQHVKPTSDRKDGQDGRA